MKDYINNIIRPKIQGDGGEIVCLSETDSTVTVAMRGECSKCHKLPLCLKWCEERIEKDKGIKVTLEAVRKKPFFWDK